MSRAGFNMQESSKRAQIQSELFPLQIRSCRGFSLARFSQRLKQFSVLDRTGKGPDSWLGDSAGRMEGVGPESYSPLHAIEMLDETEARIVDVRSKEEFAAVRVRGALHVPEEGLDELASRQFVNRGVLIFCLCREGISSAEAAAKLQVMGYHRAGYIFGGIRQWQREGLPVLKGKMI